MYEKILVPVSFEAGRDAHRAFEIAQAFRKDGGKITILHVLEHLPKHAGDLMQDKHLDTVRDEITAKLKTLTASVPDAEVVVIEGHSARAILDFADSNQKDCIVITSHRPGMQDLFLGSTAARVVRRAQCSVHVVR